MEVPGNHTRLKFRYRFIIIHVSCDKLEVIQEGRCSYHSICELNFCPPFQFNGFLGGIVIDVEDICELDELPAFSETLRSMLIPSKKFDFRQHRDIKRLASNHVSDEIGSGL